MCELEGVLAEINGIEVYGRVQGTQVYGESGSLLDLQVVNWEVCRGDLTAL